jgi:hypothetical protein
METMTILDWIKAHPAIGALSLAAAVLALALWTGRPSTDVHTLRDSSGGTWSCVSAGQQNGYAIVHCEGQERLDPTGQDGVRCFAYPQPDMVYCTDLRGGMKDLTRG